MIAAQRTIDLIDCRYVPDRITDAVLETLIEISAESRMQIWHEKTGVNLETLAALFTLHKRGAGHRHVRLYGWYEATRLKREHQERIDKERQNNEQL
jgi:hypothetical protein